MLRQIMIPSKENSTISIPSEFYGKEVEILIFPFKNVKSDQNSDNINDIFNKYLFTFDNYKFNRDEANNYE
jgi:hypothetical protein